MTHEEFRAVLALNRDHMTDEGIRVTQGKTGRELLVCWNAELREVVRAAQRIRLAYYLITTGRGTRYTTGGFQAVWKRVMARYVTQGGAHWRSQDIRAKSATDHKDGSHLGHQDTRMLERVYRRKAKAVEPLDFGILERRDKGGSVSD